MKDILVASSWMSRLSSRSQSGVELFFVPEGSADTAQSKAGPASASKRKPPENKAQKGVAPEAPGPEKQTQLKRRGEVVQTVQYIGQYRHFAPPHCDLP